MELHQAGMRWGVFEMKGGCLENIGTEFVPGLRFREYGVAQGTGVITTFVRVSNFEDQLHYSTIPEAEMDGISGPASHSLVPTT